jgi:type I restriction enzyme, S subunit
MTWASNIAVRTIAEVSLGRQRSPQHAEGPFMVKYLRAANVKDGELDLSDVMSMNFTPDEQRVFGLRPGDVLITEGSGSLASVGASAVWQGEYDEPVCFQNTLLRMRPRTEITDGRFLGWWARSAFGSGAFASLAGGANIFHLSAERVRAMRINLPSLEEQYRIADFLDAETARADRLGFLQKAALGLLDERSNALLDLSLEQYAVRFGVVPLRRCIVAMGQGTSPQCDAVPAGDDEWGVLKVSCLRPGEFFPSENKRLPDGVMPKVGNEVREGDLLITRANTPALVGATAVVPEVRRKLLLSDKIFRVRLASGIEPHYVAAVAKGSRVRSMCSAVSNGASQSMANIRFEEVKEWPIPKASIGEQERLVLQVTESQAKTGRLRMAVERQLELLAERRQALITAAVTGQIDVTTARGVDVS